MRCNVLDYGAANDGGRLSHEAINRALADCSAKGGGTVVVPPGRYLCGTIRLASNVLLELEAGARIVGTDELDQYAHFYPPESDEGSLKERWHRCLILAEEVRDCGIVGAGVIDGAKVFDALGEEKMRGPHTILAGHSERLLFRDFTVLDSANYALLVEYCDDLDFRNLTVKGGWDGIHIRGRKGRDCERISIVGCDFQTGDDAIAGRYWKDCIIQNCLINSSCNGIRVIGPATGLTVEGCLFYGHGRYPHITFGRTKSLAGILLQPGSWDPTEGRLDGVVLANNTMRDLQCALAVYVKQGNQAGRIVVDGLKATGIYQAACSFESWAEAPIGSVVLRDVAIDYSAEAVSEEVIELETQPHVGVRPLPGWGLYLRRVGRVRLDNVRMTIEGEDARPAFFEHEVGEVSRRASEL